MKTFSSSFKLIISTHLHSVWEIITVVTLLLVGTSLSATAAEKETTASDTLTASSVFLKLPIEILDILPETTRFEMLVYFESDSIYNAPNAMEGTSHLKAVTTDFLEVQISEVSTLQIKLLPLKKGETIVMTIYSVGGGLQAVDSDVRFFNSTFAELPRKKILPDAKLKNFFAIPKGSLTTMKEIEQTIPFPTVEYTASPSSTTLTARLTVKKYMNEDDYNVIRLFEKPEIKYTWDGVKFRLD